MAAHAIVRGLWTRIEPRPSLIQASASVEVIVADSEPDLLEHGFPAPQSEPFELPGTADVWARVRPDSVYPTGELLALEPVPAE